MSRVDDDRDAQMAAERVALARQQVEKKAKQKSSEASNFSKLVGQQKQGGTLEDKKSITGSVVQEALAGSEEGQASLHHGAARQFRGAFDQKLTTGWKQESTAGLETRQAESSEGEATLEAHGEEMKQTERGQEGRNSALGGSGRSKDEARTDADSGGQGDSQGGKDDGKGSQMAAGFRFNPALMAPVPVAQPKDTGASERLRALANEIAQKIVQSARVGTNAMGKAEFQIDLKSNVLSGLSIKVSGGNGKIKAVFSGNDRQVMKMLREQGESLKNALAGRGLTLEEFRIEDRA